MKITTLSIIVMFMASVLIFPVGISHAAFPPGFTAGSSSTDTTSNQTSTNQTTTSQPAMNETMTPTNATVSQPVVTKPKILLPLEQVKAGVAPKDVQCKAGFTLIFKAEDGSPACVSPTVAQILAQRGW